MPDGKIESNGNDGGARFFIPGSEGSGEDSEESLQEVLTEEQLASLNTHERTQLERRMSQRIEKAENRVFLSVSKKIKEIDPVVTLEQATDALETAHKVLAGMKIQNA